MIDKTLVLKVKQKVKNSFQKNSSLEFRPKIYYYLRFFK